jgi:hypothetical protein
MRSLAVPASRILLRFQVVTCDQTAITVPATVGHASDRHCRIERIGGWRATKRVFRYGYTPLLYGYGYY